jgi:acyl carrier protein
MKRITAAGAVAAWLIFEFKISPIMSDLSSNLAAERVKSVVQRLLKERSIDRLVGSEDDLRDVGLTSMDMVNLVLAVESEFDLMIPETSITPANFRSVAAISSLVGALQSSP